MQEIGPHRCLPMSMTVEQGRQGGYSRGMADTPATVPDHAGHRSRLRARLIGGDAEGMADYELVEYLLALAIPRRDTKPLAKTLLGAFGSLAQLVSADPDSPRRVPS